MGEPLRDIDDERLARMMRSAALLAMQERGADYRDLRQAHDELSGRVDAMAAELKANSATTSRVEQKTSEMVDIFEAVKGGFKVLGWLGSAGGKLAWLGVAGAALYGGWQAVKAWAMTGGPRP